MQFIWIPLHKLEGNVFISDLKIAEKYLFLKFMIYQNYFYCISRSSYETVYRLLYV